MKPIGGGMTEYIDAQLFICIALSSRQYVLVSSCPTITLFVLLSHVSASAVRRFIVGNLIMSVATVPLAPVS